ncbi:hypothetical protein V6R21_25125 [Limibacter armeniacum]|uniref:hypothetical protein n=1 Tax=Limibacter armeniacum TaxID=466084 RepID=UPI002FE66555
MIKKFFSLLFFIGYCQFSFGQNLQDIHSLKLQFFSLGYNYEKVLGNQFTLNSELKINCLYGQRGNFFTDEKQEYWLISPSIGVEPRYYYNFDKRENKGKNILHNAANYLSLSTTYYTGISLGKNAEAIANLEVIPMWGLRRNLGKRFFMECAIGVGAYTVNGKEWESTLGLDLGISYSLF